MVIKTVRYWHKNRHIDQWNRIESLEINPCVYDQLIFDKGGTSIQWSKDNFFNTCCWESWTGTCEKVKLDHQLTLCTRINVKWIKDLNISHDTIKILAENIDGKILDISHSDIFADISPRAMEIKGKNKQMGLHQIKKLLHA